MIIRTGIITLRRADKGQVLYPGNILRVGAMQVTVRVCLRIQFYEFTGVEHSIDNLLVLFGATGTPVDIFRLGQCADFINPLFQTLITGHGSSSWLKLNLLCGNQGRNDVNHIGVEFPRA